MPDRTGATNTKLAAVVVDVADHLTIGDQAHRLIECGRPQQCNLGVGLHGGRGPSTDGDESVDAVPTNR